MKKVLILKGLPGSGKSFWAKGQITQKPGSFKRINKDELRAMLDNGRHSKSNEAFVLRQRDRLIIDSLLEGKNVIVDDTNLNPVHETNIRELLKEVDCEVETKFFDTPLDTCIERDAQRGEKSVGREVIMDMYTRYLKVAVPALVQDKSLPAAVIVDIDGTLAKMNGRGPYEYDKVLNDTVNEPVAKLVRNMFSVGKQIILVSGRKSICRQDTATWLKENDIPHEALLMRSEGDDRNDAIVKREIYDKEIAGKYFIEFVLDDRDRVVDMWRGLGLTCLQVDYGNF